MAVYFLLNSEDYRWPWLSFFAAASTAVYVFIYAIFFFFVKTGYVHAAPPLCVCVFVPFVAPNASFVLVCSLLPLDPYPTGFPLSSPFAG